MEDKWEDTFASANLLAKKAGEQAEHEVKDSWEDDDEELPPPEPVPQTSAPMPAKQLADKSKSKLKVGLNGSQDVEERTLTAQELEELQRKSDLQNIRDTFGITDDQKCAFSIHEPTTKDDFKQFVNFLVSEISKHHKKKEYTDFLSELFRMLCLDLDSEHVRRYSKDLSILASEMQKREKETEKQNLQKQKASKKPAISQGKRGMLDDITDAADNFYGGDDDDDFM